jgi:hypothetical protein
MRQKNVNKIRIRNQSRLRWKKETWELEFQLNNIPATNWVVSNAELLNRNGVFLGERFNDQWSAAIGRIALIHIRLHNRTYTSAWENISKQKNKGNSEGSWNNKSINKIIYFKRNEKKRKKNRQTFVHLRTVQFLVFLSPIWMHCMRHVGRYAKAIRLRRQDIRLWIQRRADPTSQHTNTQRGNTHNNQKNKQTNKQTNKSNINKSNTEWFHRQREERGHQ